MKIKIANLRNRVLQSYWFIPSIMLAGAMALACMSIWVDMQVQDHLPSWFRFGGARGVTALLSTVAASAVTVAAVVFSITIAALTQASSQYGPRLLRNFMKDRGNQFVLGAFLSTFLFCLLVIVVAQDNEDGIHFVPRISTALAILLGIASLCVLIFFIHHISTSIQAPHVTALVAADLERAILKLYPEEMGRGMVEDDEADEPAIPPEYAREEFGYCAPRSGYLQAIDSQGLLELAIRNDSLLRLHRRPGHFVAHHDVLLMIHPRVDTAGPPTEAFESMFIIHTDRTPEQDVEYCVNQLVEVALRALSSGINDPFTAMNCVDWLGSAAARLASRKTPSRFRYDDNHQLRVITDRSTFAGFIDSAFDQIRQTGWHHVAVSIRILQVMANLVPHLRTTEQKKIIQTHVELVYGQALDSVRTEYDLRDLKATYARASEALRKSLGWNKPRLA